MGLCNVSKLHRPIEPTDIKSLLSVRTGLNMAYKETIRTMCHIIQLKGLPVTGFTYSGTPLDVVFNLFFLPHQGRELIHNVQKKVIISNQSLVLQKVTRADSGVYTCTSHNAEGDGMSNSINLDVRCK